MNAFKAIAIIYNAPVALYIAWILIVWQSDGFIEFYDLIQYRNRWQLMRICVFYLENKLNSI